MLIPVWNILCPALSADPTPTDPSLFSSSYVLWEAFLNSQVRPNTPASLEGALCSHPPLFVGEQFHHPRGSGLFLGNDWIVHHMLDPKWLFWTNELACLCSWTVIILGILFYPDDYKLSQIFLYWGSKLQLPDYLFAPISDIKISCYTEIPEFFV